MAQKDDYLEILLSLGLVAEGDIAAAKALLASLLAKHEKLGIKEEKPGVVDILLRCGLLSSRELATAKGANFGAEVVLLEGNIPNEVINRIKPDIARMFKVIPIEATDSTVVVAIADPTDLDTIDSLFHLLKADIEMKVASEEDITAALNKYYPLDPPQNVPHIAGPQKQITEKQTELVWRGEDSPGSSVPV